MSHAILPGQRHWEIAPVRHGVSFGVVFAIDTAFGKILNATVTGATQLADQLFTVSVAPGAGGTQVLRTRVHASFTASCWGVIQLVNGVLEGQRLKAALLAQSWMKRPADLRDTLRPALHLPRLLGVCCVCN